MGQSAAGWMLRGCHENKTSRMTLRSKILKVNQCTHYCFNRSLEICCRWAFSPLSSRHYYGFNVTDFIFPGPSYQENYHDRSAQMMACDMSEWELFYFIRFQCRAAVHLPSSSTISVKCSVSLWLFAFSVQICAIITCSAANFIDFSDFISKKATSDKSNQIHNNQMNIFVKSWFST